MKKIGILSVLMAFGLISPMFSSQINRISLSELADKADLIVIAGVVNLIQEENIDRISIQIETYLKGKREEKEFTFPLVSRGGLKNFDPSLKIGDTGVFFLKLGANGIVEKAYWGSIATFSRNHFFLTENSEYAKHLERWLNARIKNKLVNDANQYKLGFSKGFNEPPGLVDGSPDYNLGHSDGMQAKMKKLPDEKQ